MQPWSRMLLRALGISICALSLVGQGHAAMQCLNARAIFDRAVSTNIVLLPDGSALQLKSGEVVEDDGPASGFSYKPSIEVLSPGIEIRKQFLIPNPRASRVILFLAEGGQFNIDVNGVRQKPGPPEKTYFGEWEAYKIDPVSLKPGVNDVVISGSGKLRIARADDSYVELPHRSARSADGGRTWKVDCLGPKGDIDGEYYVRLYLEHYLASGSLTLPVMDSGNLEEHPLAPPLGELAPVRISVSASAGSQGRITVRVRSGTEYVPSPDTWSEWAPLAQDGILKAPRGRYVQVALTLATTDPLATPKLTEVSITSDPKVANDWTSNLKVADIHNEEIVRTSIPFRYEPFHQPELKELRERYHLDEVVGGAQTDLEIISKLAAWSSQAWPWEQWHLDQFYPPWNALEILKKAPDGKTVGGFCQQYDLVFLQACESFGFVGRDISIGSGTLGRPTIIGHEPMEIWSNQFHKWIYIDSTAGYYPLDSATGMPLSLFELRQRQIRALRGKPADAIRIVRPVDTVHEWHGLDTDLSFGELRLIPRSNFLEQKYPLPLNNGKGGWTWDGFQVWTDADVPAEPLYPHLVTRRGNFEWTLNQAHFVLEPTATPGEFRVHLDTETPGFDTFLAQIDGGTESPVCSGFTWKLHAGRNILKVWPRNNAGRDGIASWINLEMPGAAYN